MRAGLFFTFLAVFAATAAVTLLGITGRIVVPDQYLKVLFTSLLLEVVAAVITLFKATDWFGSVQMGTALKAVRGGWWQLVGTGKDNAISYFTISRSEERQQTVLEGEAYTPEGMENAEWWSIAASLDATSCELYYFWRGDEVGHDGDFSGVGYFRFDEPKDTKVPEHGTGWFTIGNLDQLNLAGRRKVEIVRANDSETAIMIGNDPEAKRKLAAAVYARNKPASPTVAGSK